MVSYELGNGNVLIEKKSAAVSSLFFLGWNLSLWESLSRWRSSAFRKVEAFGEDEAFGDVVDWVDH